LEELFDLLKAIVICFQKAGMQVKASKMIFGVTEISFHNYTMSKDQTRPKDENLDPIKNCAIPESVTNVKAFLDCTQQMAHHCQRCGLAAAPLHELTRDKVVFPKPWLAGTAYDTSFNGLKSMMLNENLFLWNKVSGRRLFVEVVGVRVHVSTQTNQPTCSTKTKAVIGFLAKNLRKQWSGCPRPGPPTKESCHASTEKHWPGYFA
jgi:hypothetical protein